MCDRICVYLHSLAYVMNIWGVKPLHTPAHQSISLIKSPITRSDCNNIHRFLVGLTKPARCDCTGTEYLWELSSFRFIYPMCAIHCVCFCYKSISHSHTQTFFFHWFLIRMKSFTKNKHKTLVHGSLFKNSSCRIFCGGRLQNNK